MELPIYNTLEEFKEYYLDALADFPELKNNKIKLLREYHKNYEVIADEYHENETILKVRQCDYDVSVNVREKIRIFVQGLIPNLEHFDPDKVLSRLLDHTDVTVIELDFIKPYLYGLFETIKINKKHYTEKIDPILDFIKNEIKEEQLNLLRFQPQQSIAPELETPELDFSDNPDKVKVIMLEKLGIIDYIKNIQTKPGTILHTSEILSAITGIKSKTIHTYLYPMLRPYRDDDDKNSPYKNPENLLKAETELIKLKIKNKDANR